eukprot:12009021-Alexandrium_andersonii.AAC.1
MSASLVGSEMCIRDRPKRRQLERSDVAPRPYTTPNVHNGAGQLHSALACKQMQLRFPPKTPEAAQSFPKLHHASVGGMKQPQTVLSVRYIGRRPRLDMARPLDLRGTGTEGRLVVAYSSCTPLN